MVQSDMSPGLRRLAIDALHLSCLHRLVGGATCGMGAIFMLHRVRPKPPATAFAPNRILEITPQFLEQTIQHVLRLGREIVSLDEMHRRLLAGGGTRPFVCFTLDDGYADCIEHALPIFERHQAPFTIYLTTGLPDHRANLWWLLLEQLIRDHAELRLRIEGRTEVHRTATVRAKYAVYGETYRRLRRLPAETCLATVNQLAADYGQDPAALCAREAMTWAMARQVVTGGLGAIEAHTLLHHAVSRQEPAALLDDVERCRARIAEMTGYRPRHFAYPFGDPDAAGERDFRLLQSLNFATATTTRKGVLFAEHRHALAALPRVPLNGDYQSLRYLDVVVSGLPFALAQQRERHRLRETEQPAAVQATG